MLVSNKSSRFEKWLRGWLAARRSAIRQPKSAAGFTLFELIVTLVVLSILVMGTIPLAQTAAKRQREMRLRETLRQIRGAIDEFKRDTIGACQQGQQGAVVGNNPTVPAQPDPRSRVLIDDCKIFSVDNLDRYPPNLEVLVDGVKVRPRGMSARMQTGVFDSKNATEINDNKEVTKYYLRELPVDPMTGKADWRLRSSYQSSDATNWDEVNVFDVRSNSDEEALNGEKYSDW